MRERLRRRIERVQAEFGLLDHTVVLEKIPALSIREEDSTGRYRLCRERIVDIDLSPDLRLNKVIKLIHTKPELSLEDLRHEFCHFANPQWSEERVLEATRRFPNRKP